MFDPAYPIASLRPADYNPRRIDEDSLAALCESLRTLGLIKPVVALSDGLIVAGHQRTRAARMIGVETTPVCFLSKKPSPADEIKFNQLHNGTDLDSGDEGARVAPGTAPGFAMADFMAGNFRSKGAVIRTELARMLTAYGNWGGCVATMSGEVLSGGSYVLAAKVLGMKIRTCYVTDAQADIVRSVFAKTYGKFDYSAIDRQTFNQTFAQLNRLRGGPKQFESPTYQWLLSETVKGERILDFGCGQGDYVKALTKQGHDIVGMEFFRRDGGALDIGASQRMVDALAMHLKVRGQFDVVICDYVMNSVDTQQAQEDVLASLSAFCRMGGRIYLSGRGVASLEKFRDRSTLSASKARYVEFLDADGLSATYRAGEWFFQKFHRPEEVRAMIARHFNDDGACELRDNGMMWQARITKTKTSPMAREGIAREFDLPLPNGRRFGRSAYMLDAMAAFL